MLAMKRAVTLRDREDFFNTTNKPRVLPNKAMKKITEYANVKRILASAGRANHGVATVGLCKMCVPVKSKRK